MNFIVPLLKSIKMFDDELVEVVYNDNVKVTVKGVDEAFELYDEVVGNRRVVKLLIIGKGTEISDEAKQYIVQQNIKRKNFIIAEAIVVNSQAQKIISNLYIRIIGGVYPTQFFTEADKATIWLRQHAENAGAVKASG